MPSWQTVLRRHGTARLGKFGAGNRGLALRLSSMGDPRFSLKRAFTIPKKVRQGLMNVATGALGIVPGGGLIKAGMQALGPKAFPNVDPRFFANNDMGMLPPLAGGGGPGAAYAPVTGGSNVDWDKLHKAFKHPGPKFGHHRRLNVTNVKALRRGMRRVTGFAKLARSVMTFTSHHRIKKHRRKR